MKGSNWIEVRVLPPEEQEPILNRMAAESKAWRTKAGLVPVPPMRPSSTLWCGHPATQTIIDDEGVSICPTCDEE